MDVRVFSTDTLLKGEASPTHRFDFGPSVPSGFVFSPDGRFLYGTSYLTGVSNVFRYDLETSQTEAVSNTETGFFRPIPLGGDELIVFRFTGRGLVPARITGMPIKDAAPITFLGERLAEERPVVRTWMAGSPADIPWETLVRKDGIYKLAGGLTSESFYPIVQGYKSSPAVGMRWNLSDRLQLNRLSLSAAFSPDAGLPASERTHLRAHYQRYDWRAEATLNYADFYDLFGPTKSGRKGHHVSVGRRWTLLFDEPRRLELDVEGSYSGHLDRLPDYQNVPVDVNGLVTVDAGLSFSDVRNSLGSVDDETGVRWAAVAQTYVVDGEWIPRARGDFAYGHALPIEHSSIWFRQSAGLSPRDRSQPFANFFFGGFGNNYVDRGDEKRYRDYVSFPGAELNELGGRNFVKSTVEWNLPPWRFARLGTPGLYATWLRPAVFVTGLLTDLEDDTFRRTAASVGAQADIRISALSALDMTFSVGAAVAFEDGERARRELMVSLKVLR
jgi:hypothetical protein